MQAGREESAGGGCERLDAARNRSLLLRTALEMVSERGAEALTMDDLARRAGVGKGTVFRRFGSRAGVMRALLDHAERDFQEGYMAGWTEEADGSLVLVENHCPICAAATACQGFCRAELDVFSAVLGPDVSVTREEHIVSGGRRCSYAIREISP